MSVLLAKLKALCSSLNIVAGVSLTFIMFLTCLDVILRFFKMPIVGTYELVSFAGAIIVGFAVPVTTLMRGHIFVDFFTVKFPKPLQNTINVLTRLAGIALFGILGWNLIKMGMDLQRTGEVSLTLQLPFYPVAYATGICCFVQCLVFLVQMGQIKEGSYE